MSRVSEDRRLLEILETSTEEEAVERIKERPERIVRNAWHIIHDIPSSPV